MFLCVLPQSATLLLSSAFGIHLTGRERNHASSSRFRVLRLGFRVLGSGPRTDFCAASTYESHRGTRVYNRRR